MTQPKVEVLPIEQGATPDPQNVNKHTQRGGGLLENSLRKRGAFRSIASAGKGVETPVVYAGNFTLEKAIDAGFTEVVNVHVTGNQIVNVVRDDIEPGTAAAIALGLEDNEIGKQSYNPDLDILAAVMADPAMQALRDEDAILKGLVEGMGLKSKGKDAPAETDRAAELLEKWQVKSGDLWQIGEHRLICGDCTDKAAVARVMGGEKARLEFSDPPYEFETGGGGILKEAQHMKDIKAAGINQFDPLSIELMTDTAVFCCNKKLVPVYIELANKNSQAWDLCFYKKQNTPPNFGGHLMTDTEYLPVIGKQSPNSGMEKDIYSKAYIGGLDDDHLVAWQKPLGLVEKFIKLFSNSGDVVIDRFVCTGTTLVACQNLGRRGRAVEISPAYCAVTLQRMADAFPELEIKRLE